MTATGTPHPTHTDALLNVIALKDARIQHLERVIADAPHMERCDFAATGKCVCWKSRAARKEG